MPPQLRIYTGKIAERPPFRVAVADLTGNNQASLESIKGLLMPPQLRIYTGKIAERPPFRAAVADLTGNNQASLESIKGRGRTAGIAAVDAEIVQRHTEIRSKSARIGGRQPLKHGHGLLDRCQCTVPVPDLATQGCLVVQ